MKSSLIIILITAFAQTPFAQSGNYWTQRASLPDSGRGSAISFSIGAKGYLGTGANGNAVYRWDFWEYNSIADIWVRKADFTPGIDSVGRRSAAAFAIGNNGYVGSGVGRDTIPPTGGDTMYNDFWKYNSVTDVWVQKNTLPTMGRHYYVAFSISGKGYIGTGLTEGLFGNLLGDFWEYDTTADAWTQKADFGGSPRSHAIGFSLLGKGYLGTGYDSNSIQNDFWQYDPSGNIWIPKANLTMTGRVAAAAFAIETVGKGYVGTGVPASGPYSPALWEYNPLADIWIQKVWYPGGGLSGVSAFSIGNKGYFSCGENGSNFYNDLWEYTPSTTGVDEQGKMFVSVYPNPSDGEFLITIKESDFNVTIYDKTGRLVHSIVNEKSINLSDLPKGVYFIKIVTQSQTFASRVILR